jgi:AcrR family transcriptional regulator
MTRAASLAPEARRQQLLDTAREVFAARGYHNTGVADIIEAAGVARGTFYNYFESKRAVFQAVLEAMLADIVATIAPIDVGRPVAPQVHDDLVRLVAVLVGLQGAVRILFTDAVAIDVEGADTLRAFYLSAEDRLSRALATGQRMGIVRDGDAQIMATLLIGMIREPVVQAWLHQRPVDPDAVVAEVERTLLGGVIRAR